MKTFPYDAITIHTNELFTNLRSFYEEILGTMTIQLKYAFLAPDFQKKLYLEKIGIEK